MKREAMRAAAGKAAKASAAIEAIKIIERANGYYVRLAGSCDEFGPFRTVAEALGAADLDDFADDDDGADADLSDLGYECAFPMGHSSGRDSEH